MRKNESNQTTEHIVKLTFEDYLMRITLLIVICIFIPVYVFNYIFKFCVGVGNSNYPTIKDHATVWLTEYYISIERGDFVAAEPKNYDGAVIKRVVAIGGDHIYAKDGKLFINDIEDDFAPDVYYSDFDVTVPENSYFLMGDNRAVSLDSRDFGCVTEDEITEKVIKYENK